MFTGMMMINVEQFWRFFTIYVYRILEDTVYLFQLKLSIRQYLLNETHR